MPENSHETKPLVSLLLGTLDDFDHVQELQTLLRIGLDQADNGLSEEACERLALLVSTYLCQSEPWLEEVQLGLNRMRKHVGYPIREEDREEE